MKIAILTYGSRGDIQPFLPLSVALMARGHEVKLAAPSRFKALVEGHAIQFVPLAGDPEELSRRLNNVGFNFIKMMREMTTHAVEIGADVFRQMDSACREADLIVHTFAHAVGGHTLAREKNIPDVHVQLFPMFTPTGDYPNISLPDLKIRALNRFTHIVSQKISWWASRLGFEQVRRRAGLPIRKLYNPFDKDPLRPPTPLLCAWSPNVLPPSNDWSPNTHITGYFYFDSNTSYQPPVELQKFLATGKPPVCVSFGSMVHREAEKIDRTVVEALRRTDSRGIILSGWGKVNRSAMEDVLYLDAVPHEWLLPQCAMIIHHGGAGTTSARLRAGVPNIVIPFTADQPFWGRRVHAIGAGPRLILVNNLSVEKLAEAMVEAQGDLLRERVRDLGRKIRGENGVSQAVDMLESHARDWNEKAIF